MENQNQNINNNNDIIENNNNLQINHEIEINPNDLINLNNENVQNKMFWQKLTFSYKLIFSINFIIYLLTIIHLDYNDYSICQWSILFKNQYYRMITHNFFHLGLVHISFNMMFFYFLSKDMENKLGTAYILVFIFDSVLLISLIYLTQIALMKYVIVTLFKFTEYDYNNYCSIGFSGVIFSLYYILCNFKNISESNTLFFGLIPVKWKFSPYIYLIFTHILSPRSSLIGHLSGIFSGYILKNILIYFIIPSKESIESFEEKFKMIMEFLKSKFNYKKICEVETIHQEEEIKEINKNFCEIFECNYFRRMRERDERRNMIRRSVALGGPDIL